MKKGQAEIITSMIIILTIIAVLVFAIFWVFSQGDKIMFYDYSLKKNIITEAINGLINSIQDKVENIIHNSLSVVPTNEENIQTGTTLIQQTLYYCCLAGGQLGCYEKKCPSNGINLNFYESSADCWSNCVRAGVTTTTVTTTTIRSGTLCNNGYDCIRLGRNYRCVDGYCKYITPVTTTTILTYTCSDTDGGKNYNILGTASDTFHHASMQDYCFNVYGTWGKDLYEYYCTADGTFTFDLHTCPSVCVNGVCKVPSGSECYDTDGGNNWNVKGTTYCASYPNGEFYDWCSADSFPDMSRRKLVEQNCISSGCTSQGGLCPNTPCYDGKCQDYPCSKDMGLPGNRVYVDSCSQCPQNLQCQNECYSWSASKRGFYKCWVYQSQCVIGVDVPGYSDTPCS